MIDQLGCNLFLELGPGEVLAGLVGRIRKGTEVVSIANRASLEEALPKLRDSLLERSSTEESSKVSMLSRRQQRKRRIRLQEYRPAKARCKAVTRTAIEVRRLETDSPNDIADLNTQIFVLCFLC